uniref:Ion transport domain-containing protein n=1 Tax=Haptolina ericina TaxID=156174 RepID=A0A7S3BSD5_9EUKA
MDEVRMKKEITVEVRNKWLTIYANLPHEGIGLGVAYEFVKEYDEREKWVKLQAWTNERSTIDKPSALGGALLRNVELVQDAQQAAIQMRASQRNIEAEKFDQLSERLQLAIATCLDYMGTNALHMVVCSNEGNEALNLAAQQEQRVLLSQPAVIAAMERKYLGERLFNLIKAPTLNGCLSLCGVVCLNILAIVPVALSPQQASRNAGWGKLFPQHCYLLQTGFFQAWLFSICDLSFTLLVSFYGTRMPLLLLLWSFAALYFELEQVVGREANDKSKKSLINQFHGYLRQDPFNGLDLSALVGAFCALLMRSFALYHPGLWGLDETNETALQDFSGEYAEPFLAVSTLLLWGRQLRLLTLASRSITPLVLMVVNMVDDVAQYLLLLAIVLLGFAASLHILFQNMNTEDAVVDPFADLFLDDTAMHEAATEAAITRRMLGMQGRMLKRGGGGTGNSLADDPGQSPECMVIAMKYSTFLTALEHLFEISLSTDVGSDFPCMAQASSPTAALILIFAYTMLVMLLLLNMLIAMMGKTFDKLWDDQQDVASMQFCRSVQDWESQKEMPAPFNILSRLSYFCFFLPKVAYKAILALIVDHRASSFQQMEGHIDVEGHHAYAQAHSTLFNLRLPGHDTGGAQLPTMRDAVSVCLGAVGFKHGVRKTATAMPASQPCPPSTPASHAGHKSSHSLERKESKRLEQLARLKEAVGEKLVERFGEQDSNGQLIDQAVRRSAEQIKRLEKKFDDLREQLFPGSGSFRGHLSTPSPSPNPMAA